ncbi:hypothetical protein GP486_005732 [Trichoglossum hirsutum]|uniref:HNH nuclease domain-containing protein n=1 Tax=Trichoglossum hirsutum TaxID=265104 RepID=A0A9P8RM61_9PEZI|nr:hypothetical protein GP486_005732 [Trichoglossum hirsutum]
MSRATVRRNVHFLNGENNEILGFWQNGSVSWSQIAEWMHIVIILPSTQYAFFRCLESGNPENPATNHGPSVNLSGNNNAVHPGYYVVLSANGEPLDIPITEERAIPRSVSYCLTNPDPRVSISISLQFYKVVILIVAGQQIAAFRQRVRERDDCCVVTGILAEGDYDAFEAAHIFPLAHLDLWRSGQWSQKIEDDFPDVGDSKIHSIQNGILLAEHAHTFFDKYKIAIDPDDNFKIISFVKDRFGFDGRYMIQSNYPQHYQPLRSLLKYHFRMAVLCNMKARGPEYDWDEDIPPGMDPVAEISNSEQGKLRFELVMAERLNHLVD